MLKNRDISFPTNVRRIMKKKGIGPTGLMEEIERLGHKITYSALNNYISEKDCNRRVPSIPVMLYFARALNVKLIDLLGEEYIEQESEIDNVHELEHLTISKSLYPANKLKSFEVENKLLDFNVGDIAIIDESKDEITSGYYVIVTGKASRMCKAVYDGLEYTLDFGAGNKVLEHDDFKVVGKVVLHLTKQV